jgi:hypothetical protein
MSNWIWVKVIGLELGARKGHIVYIGMNIWLMKEDVINNIP